MGATTRGRWKLAAAGVLVLAGGLAVRAVVAGDSGEDALLVVDTDGAVSLLEPSTGAAVYSVADAVPTHDRSALLTTRAVQGGAILETRDPATGEVTSSTTLTGDLTVRTVSPRSGAVALLPGPRPTGLYEPTPRERTSITVAYFDDRPSRTYELAGNIEPEMFSLDETKLFILDFQPPLDPSTYDVRVLDLETGELADTGAPQVELNSQMRGKARAQVLHPDGTFLYTLYTTEDPDSGARSAFIHVINLEEEWSFCIFLPAPIGSVSEPHVGMGIAPNGESIFVADPSSSTVARVDAAALTVVQVTTVPTLRDNGVRAAVAVAGDGDVYLGSGPVLVELDAALTPAAAWSQTQAISGLGVSASGEELLVAGGGVVTILDRASRHETAELRAPSDGGLDLLGPPRGSVTQFPVECAC